MKNSLVSSRGNAILISIAITGFLFLAAAGASKVIMGSLQDSPKIVESSEALYAAESAMEAALYEAKSRGSGYTTEAGTQPGDAAYVGLNKINSSSGSWDVNSQSEMDRDLTEDILEYQKTFFIPPRKVVTASVGEEDLSNWRKVKMGEKVTFDLFSDTAPPAAPPLALGGGTPVAGQTPTPTPTGTIQGPNGMLATNTKSILMKADGTANDDIKEVFIDIFIPAAVIDNSIDGNPIVLSWQVEGRTDGTQGLPQVVKLVASDSCTADPVNGMNAGVICYDRFTDGLTGDGITPHLSENANIGKWVRLKDPGGLLTLVSTTDSSDISVVPISITDFFKRSLLTELQNAQIYFPRLILQVGQPIHAVPPGGTTEYKMIPDAYVRVGFTMNLTANMTTIGNDFSVPDDTVTINATGSSGVVKKGIQAEIHPQEGAPMFDYSVFQP